MHVEAERDWLARSAFPVAYVAAQQEENEGTIDAVDADGDRVMPEGLEELLQREEEMIESIPLPGVPGHEKSRREAWLKIPRRARAAIRKMHREWGHNINTVLKRILKIAKAPQEYIDAVDQHLCHECVSLMLRRRKRQR